jgi:hypothetical protein
LIGWRSPKKNVGKGKGSDTLLQSIETHAESAGPTKSDPQDPRVVTLRFRGVRNDRRITLLA